MITRDFFCLKNEEQGDDDEVDDDEEEDSEDEETPQGKVHGSNSNPFAASLHCTVSVLSSFTKKKQKNTNLGGV